MPETAEIEIADEKTEKEFGTSIADVFSKALPLDDDDQPEKTQEKQPEKAAVPPKVEPEKKAEDKKPDKSSRLPESVFDTEPKTKVEEVKTEVEPVKVEAPPELKGKARENFEKLATKQYETEKLLREERQARTKAEEKAAKGDPDAQARVKELETQNQQMSAIVQRASLENHPEFQAKYDIPRKQLTEMAKTAFSDAGGDPAEMEAALSLTGKARIEKLEELLGRVSSDLLKRKIERANENLELVEADRSRTLQNQGEVLKQLQEKDQATRHKAFEEYEKTTKQNLVRATEILRDEHKFEVFKTVDDPNYQWWNDQFKKMQDSAETIMLKTSDPTELAVAAQLAVAAPVYRAMFHEERKARITAEDRLKQYEDGEPGIGGGEKKSQKQTESEEDEEMPLAAAIIKSVKVAQGRT